MSEKHKKVCRSLNYFEHFLIFIFNFRGCVSFSAFASLVNVRSRRYVSSAVS